MDKNKLFKGYDVRQLPQEVMDTTFKELNGKSLVFSNDIRPFKRCLSFHALQAFARAKEEGWLPDDFKLDKDVSLDYMTDDGKTWYKNVHQWFEHAVSGPPTESEVGGDDASTCAQSL